MPATEIMLDVEVTDVADHARSESLLERISLRKKDTKNCMRQGKGD